jgi:hypothetical protein
VVEVAQYGEALVDELVTTAAVNVDDEADATGVVLVGGVVETLLSRHPEVSCPSSGPEGLRTTLSGRAWTTSWRHWRLAPVP